VINKNWKSCTERGRDRLASALNNSADFGPGIAVSRLRFCVTGFLASEYMRKYYLKGDRDGAVKIGACVM